MNPRALNVVACLFIASGALALVDYVVDLVSTDRVHFPVQILNLWIGRWLLEREPRGYRFAVFFSGAAIILIPIGLAILAMVGAQPAFVVAGVEFAHPSFPVYALIMLARAALNVWQFRVLRRSDIRALFPDPVEGGAQPA